jgi:hypothetical protein
VVGNERKWGWWVAAIDIELRLNYTCIAFIALEFRLYHFLDEFSFPSSTVIMSAVKKNIILTHVAETSVHRLYAALALKHQDSGSVFGQPHHPSVFWG